MVAGLATWVDRIARGARAAVESPADDEQQATLVTIVAGELTAATGELAGTHLYLADRSTRTLRLTDSGSEVEGLPREIRDDTEHFVVRTAATRRPALAGAHLGLPLALAEEVLGVLALTFSTPRVVTASELEPLQAIADVLALALAAARAAGRTSSTRLVQAASGNGAISSALEVVPESQLHVAIQRGFHLWPYAREESIPEFLRGALRTILDRARAEVGAQFGALGITRSAELPFDPWVYSGMSEEVAKAVGRTPRPVGTLGRVAMNGDVLRLRDVRTHPAFQGLPPHHPEITSILAIPIRYGQLNVGNIYLANKLGAAEFTAEDERVVTALASHAGQALQIAFLRTAIEAQRAQLQSTLDCVPNGVLFIDAENRHVMANPRAMSLAGRTITPEGGVSQYMSLVRRPDGRPVSIDETPMVAALKGETTRNVEAVICTADGRRTPVLVSAAPVRSVDNEILGAVVVFEEITALKELERMRSEYSAVIAHDLRAPLHVIQLQIAALLRDAHDEVRAPVAALRRIQRSTSQLSQMTNDLLDATRTELRRFSLECESVAPELLTAQIVDQLRPAIEHHPLEVSAEAGLSRASLDPLRFQQIITNLIENAAKQSARDTPISIHLAPAASGILLSVQDHGVGIPEDEIPMLFDRYYPARRSRERRSGLGLGLYIVKGLVDAHGGRVWVESHVGEGTTFYVWFPAELQPQPQVDRVELGQPR